MYLDGPKKCIRMDLEIVFGWTKKKRVTIISWMLCGLFDLSMFEVDDTPPDSHCEVCDPWEGGKDPWIRKGAIEQQRKTTRFSPIPPLRLSPEELVQLNKWLATPISTPAPTRPPLPSTPKSTKSVFVLAGDCCDVVTDWDGFKSVDIDFEVVMDEVVDNVGEVLDWVEGNLLNDDEPSLSPPPLRPSPHRHNLAKCL